MSVLLVRIIFYLSHTLGDAILCIFCDHGSEKSPLSELTRRAVECGYDIQNSSINHYNVAKDVILTVHSAVSAGDLYTIHVGGSQGEWRRITQGATISKLSTALANSNSGELVIAKDTFELVKPYIRAERIKEGGDYLLKGISKSLPSRTPLPTVTIEPIMEPLMRSFIDRDVLTKMDNGQGNWISTIKTLTILFLSITEPPHTSQEGDYMKEALSIMAKNIAMVQETVNSMEGSVGNLLVDEKGSIMILAFGHPTSHDDDTLRAAKLAKLIQTLIPKGGNQLFGFGITRGKCFVGAVGSSQRQDFTLVSFN